MRYPPRLGHLATRQILAAKLIPLYSEAHHVDEEEAREMLERALATPLLEEILAATWAALLGGVKRLDDDGLLEKIARSLRDRPMRVGRKIEATPALSAFLIRIDLAANTASDSARKVLESDAGKAMAAKGMKDATEYLAKELTR